MWEREAERRPRNKKNHICAASQSAENFIYRMLNIQTPSLLYDAANQRLLRAMTS